MKGSNRKSAQVGFQNNKKLVQEPAEEDARAPRKVDPGFFAVSGRRKFSEGSGGLLIKGKALRAARHNL